MSVYPKRAKVPKSMSYSSIQSVRSLSSHPKYNAPSRYYTLCLIRTHSQNIYPLSIPNYG